MGNTGYNNDVSYAPIESTCLRCSRMGHIASVCYAKTNAKGENIRIVRDITCDKCGKSSIIMYRCKNCSDSSLCKSCYKKMVKDHEHEFKGFS